MSTQPNNFVHLNVHSHYSLLAALPKIPDLIEAAKEDGMTAIALTDNGSLYGAIEFYKDCKKAGIKPIIGVHAYIAARSRKDKQAGVDNRRTRLILLAKDHAGYKSLVKLVTISHFDGFYYKPRLDRELISQYPAGLVCIIPSLGGEVAAALRGAAGPEAPEAQEKAREIIAFYKTTYGAENVFLEITHHTGIEGHEALMEHIIAIAKATNTPLVAAHDIYYISPDDKQARNTLMMVNSSGDGGDRGGNGGLGADDTDFSFMTTKKMEKLFKKDAAIGAEALANTAKIAAMCNLDLTLGKWLFPNYIVESGRSYDDELRFLAYEGIKTRDIAETPEMFQRLEYELKVIKDKGYAQYFLVVSDLLRFAHENNILTTIRGSVAGSLVTYLAHITNVDPLEYKLPFERFLNPERPSAPDIDMDYADNRRDEVIEYARKKYGKDHVAQIGTFGTMMARGAVRDVARAMGFGYEVGDKISKLIPMGAQGFPMTIDRALDEVPELKKLYKEDDDTKQIIEMAKKIEGCARHISVHAAGVVIGPQPLTEYVPLQYDTKGEDKIITQYDMHGVGEDGMGLLKFDFLGIKNLSILADAVDRVKKIEGVTVDIENVDVTNKKTFEMLARGETIGLFQLNGSGMTRFLKDLKPSTIHDINAMVALYRPGPMEKIPDYIERKHDHSKIRYLDPRLKDILDRSYGVITYQDDVMLTAIKLGGYSWLEADKLRKAMGKKIPKEMEEQKGKLIAGLVKNGMKEDTAKELWTLIEPFAAYGFNKCVTGDTRITDAKSGAMFTVKELYESDKHISLHSLNETKKLVPQKISAVLQNGVKNIFELKTRTGRSIRATDNHPFLTFNGWKNLGTLEIGERIAIPRKLSVKSGLEIPAYRAATLGYLIAEGNLCHPHGPYYYSTQEDEISDFIFHAQQFENSKFTIDRSKPAASVYCGQKNQRLGNSLQKWLIRLELTGKKATEKSIPREVFRWKKETQALLLGKMWQGDGCVSPQNQQVFYSTSSIQLARDVQHLLVRFEITSTIHRKKFNYRGGIKIGYNVTICHRENLARFGETIGTHLIDKKKRLLIDLLRQCNLIATIAARGTKDVIPAAVMNLVRSVMCEQKITVREAAYQTGLAERLFSYDAKKIGYQREVLTRMGNVLASPDILNHSQSDIYWDEVVSILPAGKEMTYDISMPVHHNFVANDIIVHNSHAASYGRVAYQTAYMKANFPAIYMSAVLTADSGDVEKIGETITECKRMGIPVLPPSVNESFSQFTIVKGAEKSEKDRIRFGLVTIKNFGQGAATAIIEERKRAGRFTSLSNFLERVKDKNVNKKTLEALIKAGALDELGERGVMLANIETLLMYNKELAKASANQDSLFGGLSGAAAGSGATLKLAPVPAAPMTDRLAWEKELLGLYVSGHPLDKYRDILEKRDVNVKKIREEGKEGTIVVVAGIIEEMRPIATKKGEQMVFMKIADLSGSMEAVVFPRTLIEFKSLIVLEKCIAIKGKVSHRNGEVSLLVEKVKALV
ncbi:MAG: DNA polymerase III subunit alpha [Patescibacteria group bacterium]